MLFVCTHVHVCVCVSVLSFLLLPRTIRSSRGGDKARNERSTCPRPGAHPTPTQHEEVLEILSSTKPRSAEPRSAEPGGVPGQRRQHLCPSLTIISQLLPIEGILLVSFGSKPVLKASRMSLWKLHFPVSSPRTHAGQRFMEPFPPARLHHWELAALPQGSEGTSPKGSTGI